MKKIFNVSKHSPNGNVADGGLNAWLSLVLENKGRKDGYNTFATIIVEVLDE